MTYTAEIETGHLDLRRKEFSRGDIGLRVRISAAGTPPWVAVFRGLATNGMNRLETWPDGDLLLAIANGYAYLLDAVKAQLEHELPTGSVSLVLRHETGLVVLGTYEALVAVASDGVRWTAHRLS